MECMIHTMLLLVIPQLLPYPGIQGAATVGRWLQAKPIQVNAPGVLQTPSNQPLPPIYTLPTPSPPNHRRSKPAQGP